MELRASVRDRYETLRALDRELVELREVSRDRERRRDFLAFQVREIDEAEIDPDAIERLRSERSRIAHAEKLRGEGSAAASALAGDLATGDEPNAVDLLSESGQRLEALAELDATLGPLAERVASATEEVRDVASDLERYVSGIEADPGRLAEADAALARVEALARKYGGSVAEVLRYRDEAARELATLENADQRIEAIDVERRECARELKRLADELTASRRKVGRRSAKRVETALRELAMPEARFRVALEAVKPAADAPCGPGGNETPEFRFAANRSGDLLPLRKVASGGELSRTFLAIKSAIREADAGMVLVFDEVDAGIGGGVADRVGRSLAELAGQHQVLCITHLPQIAAYASTHFRVDKSDHQGRTRARVVKVEGADRIEEIARMAGGEQIADATRRHARELLRSRATL